MKGTTARTVDEYLAKVPQPARATLEKLRQVIRAAAPNAEEVISYRIPTFRLRRALVGFAAFDDHCSFWRSRRPRAALPERDRAAQVAVRRLEALLLDAEQALELVKTAYGCGRVARALRSRRSRTPACSPPSRTGPGAGCG